MIVPDLPSLRFLPKALLSGSPGPWAGHLPFAYDLIAALGPSMIVELGVHYGDSYFAFCQAIAENNIPCTCYGVDTWRGDPHGGFYEDAIYEAVSRHNETTYASFSYLLRSTFDQAVGQFSSESIGLLHIDGYHTYDAARHDFDNWFPKVRPGGIVLIHDIVERRSDFGVWRLWDELQHRYPTFTFYSDHGLGVLRKPSPEPDDLESLFASSENDRERIRSYYNGCAKRMRLELKIDDSQAKDAGHSILQVFSSHSYEYLPEADGNQILEAGRRLKVTVGLPRGLGNRPLRIDPSNRPCTIEIISLTLRNVDGNLLWDWHAGKDANLRVEGTAFRIPSEECLRVLSYGSDPQVYLPEISDGVCDQAIELEICMQIDLEFGITRRLLEEHHKGERALRDLPAELEQGYKSQFQSLQEQNILASKQMDQIRQLHLSVIADREHVYNVNARLSQDLTSARHEIQILSSEQSKMKIANENYKAELNRLSAAHENGKSELVRVSAGHENCSAGLENMQGACRQARVALEAEKQIRFGMEQSRSWRATRPLRTFAALFRQFLKN